MTFYLKKEGVGTTSTDSETAKEFFEKMGWKLISKKEWEKLTDEKIKEMENA